MSKTTTNLGLYEAEGTDVLSTFNIGKVLNDNWDKIDADSKKKTDDINEINNTIGTDTLETTSQTLKGAINEVKGDIPTSLPANGGHSDITDKLQTARNIALTGDVTGTASFDGSADASINTTLKDSGVTAGIYKSVTVNSKGQVTEGTNPTTLSGYGITDAVNLNDVVTVATPNKILKLDSDAKLPASITGDSTTLGGKSRSEFENDLAVHEADYTKHIPYLGITTNDGNAYSIDSPSGLALTDGQAIRVKFNATSTGAIALKIGSNDAVPVYDFYGNAVTNVRQYGIVTLLYEIHDGSTPSFTLDGKGGDGTATEEDVLASKTFTSKDGFKTGTMSNNGAVIITPSTSNQIITKGYHNGNGYVKGDTNLIASNILSGKSIFGVNGSATIQSLGGKRFIEGTTQTISNTSSLLISNIPFVPYSITLTLKNMVAGNSAKISVSKDDSFYTGVINNFSFSSNSISMDLNNNFCNSPVTYRIYE